MVLPFLAAVAPFAGLIGGALGAVGQLMAPKPKTGLDLKQLRRDAEANGFNPLTIIRGGGLGSYGHVQDMRASNALSTFGAGFATLQNYDPFATERFQTEKRLAEAQIAAFGRQGAPSNMSFSVPSSAGPAGGGGVVNLPLERIGTGGAQEAPGAISDIGWIRTSTGGWTVAPSSDAKERIEDDFIQQASWAWRNQIAPALMLSPQPFPEFLGKPDPNKWQFDFLLSEWRPRPAFDTRHSDPRQPAIGPDPFGFANPRFGQ